MPEEDFPEVEYSRVRTFESAEVQSESVTLRGEIKTIGNFAIDEFGFVWSETKGSTRINTDRVVVGNENKVQEFEARIDRGLKDNTKYYARAYLKSGNSWVFGQEIEFISNGSKDPIIKDFNPKSGAPSEVISISGENLSYNPLVLRVRFGTLNAVILSATDTLIRVSAPEGTSSTPINISVVNKSVTTNGVFTFQNP